MACIGIYAILYHLTTLKKLVKSSHQELKQSITGVSDQANQLIRRQDYFRDRLTDLMRETRTFQSETTSSWNQFFTTSIEFMNHTSTALAYTLLCLQPFVKHIMSNAVDNDNYELAQECQKLLDNLSKLINYNPHKDTDA